MNRAIGFCVLLVIVGAGLSTVYVRRPHSPQEADRTRAGEKHDDASQAAHQHNHDGEVDHDKHDHDVAHDLIQLNAAVMEELGIQVAVAAAGSLEDTLFLTGEIVLNPDQEAHIVPRVGGIVRAVHATTGDVVQEGDVLAILESAELAEAKANYLGARQRVALTQATLESKQRLHKSGIVSELDFLAAQRNAAEAEITFRAADVKLHTYGFTHAALERISTEDEDALLIYELRAPFSGVVIEKHIALGELVTNATDVFVVADLSTVWVHLTVHQKDLGRLRVGSEVTLWAEPASQTATGAVSYISPVVDEQTRTATARVLLSNDEGVWRPGLFISAEVALGAIEVPVLVPRSAIQLVKGYPTIFVQKHDGFEPRQVTVGRTNERFAEIKFGLAPGEAYVAQGAFALKAELEKATFGGHGHAH